MSRPSDIMRQAATHDAEKFHEHRRGHRLLGELAEEKADGLESALAVGKENSEVNSRLTILHASRKQGGSAGRRAKSRAVDRAHNTTADSRVVPEDLEIILDRGHHSSGVAHFVRVLVLTHQKTSVRFSVLTVLKVWFLTRRVCNEGGGSAVVCAPPIPPKAHKHMSMDAMHRV
jgi:hypothetical protein